MTSVHVMVASLHVLLGHAGSTAAYRRRYGKSPLVVYRAAASPHRTASRLSGALAIAWGVVFVASVYSARWDATFVGRALVTVPRALSWSIAIAGLVIMCAAQLSMGEAFRIGQDASTPPSSLHRRGLHAVCRNPIYVGSWLALAGMTLWHPSLVLVALCAGTGVAMHLLVLAEEAFLRERFPAELAAYAARVPRYGVRLW